MKKILGLSVAALMVMGLVGGGTWAYFSDTEESTGNIFSAGTLDLGLYNTSNTSSTGSITGTFSASTWAPGDTINGTLYINNDGSIDMTSVNLTFALSAITDGTPTTVDDYNLTSDTDNLSKMIYISQAVWDSVTVGTLVNKSLFNLSSMNVDLGSLAANTEKPLFIKWTFDPDATNGCQGDSIDITITVLGKQQ
jgi:spore coat-associated protein N